MKKYFLVLFLYLTGCSNTEYFYASQNYEHIRQGSGIIYDATKISNKKIQTIQTALLSAGLWPINLNDHIARVLNQTISPQEESAVSDLTVYIQISHETMPDTVNIPIQQRTSVNSLDSRFIGNTLHTSVNYNYETVGYQPVKINRPVTCLDLYIKHHREKIVSYPRVNVMVENTPPINIDRVCALGNLSDNKILSDAINIFSQNNILTDARKIYQCSLNGCSQIQ